MKKIIGIAGWSGSGKTTVVENLIKIFKSKYNLKVCALKHAHKNFQIDSPGKDSFKFYESGADQVIISSEKQWAIINKVTNKEKTLNYLLSNTYETDIILVEGWKYSKLKKIEIYRESINKNFLYLKDDNILAIALENKNIHLHKPICKLNLNNPLEIADFILKNNFEFKND